MLDFSRTIYEDLSNYDANGAWPTLIDEYVSSRRSQANSPTHREGAHPAFRSDAPLPLSVPARPGSKRQLPQDDEEADALASRLESLRPSCDGEACAAGGGADGARRVVQEAKRCRVNVETAAGRRRSHDAAAGALGSCAQWCLLPDRSSQILAPAHSGRLNSTAPLQEEWQLET